MAIERKKAWAEQVSREKEAKKMQLANSTFMSNKSRKMAEQYDDRRSGYSQYSRGSSQIDEHSARDLSARRGSSVSSANSRGGKQV